MATGAKSPSLFVVFKKVVEETSSFTGQQFFESLVKNLAQVLGAHGVWVTEYLEDSHRLRALAFWLDGKFVDEYEYDVPGTPCEPVLKNEIVCHFPEKVVELFPRDPDLKPMGAVSYMGLALRDTDGRILGHLALLDNKPMQELPEVFTVFKIFAERAGAELRRLRYEKRLAESKSQLQGLFNGAWEAIVELNNKFEVTQVNRAAESCFQCSETNLAGTTLENLFDKSSYVKLRNALLNLEHSEKSKNSLMIPGVVNCRINKNERFPGEVSISKYENKDKLFFALFIRNVKDRLEQKATIENLKVQTSILRERLMISGSDKIVGESPAILTAVRMLHQVAPTDSTVLVQGETGTGKELFAQAIHEASARKNNALVTLNCAALPVDLIESELFGHVKGAFTGATGMRIGRFALADKGTIFLDEIGELPMALQAKLLRVLQEGSFEPIGSSQTQKVDVRVIAATNRDLLSEVQNGKFREDLYYRLNVFPIKVPPLRERGNDILLIAQTFIEKFSQRDGKSVPELDQHSRKAMLNYPWPGNVRELQNIIERALILSLGDSLDVASLLQGQSGQESKMIEGLQKVLTENAIRELEKKNILSALELTDWKISGVDGAAELLQIPSTTLSSRIKKLGIKRTL